MSWYTNLKIFKNKKIIPNKWSYTKLSQIKNCPRQWQLENNYFSGDGKKIPLLVNIASVRGTLIHLTLEKLTNLYRNDKEYDDVWDFFRKLNVRNKIEKYYLEEVCPKYETNERININDISSKIDFQLCLSKIYSLWGFSIEKKRFNSSNHSNIKYRFGSEISVETNNPPLIGVIDKYSNSIITDYKTGNKDEDKHKEQAYFYSYLLHLKNKPIDKVKILYSNKEELIFDINEEILIKKKEKINLQLSKIDNYFNSNFPAKPSIETCRFCNVKQMCDQYWIENNKNNIDFIDEDGLNITNIYRDVEISELTYENEDINLIGIIGTGKTKEFGNVNIKISKKFITFVSKPNKARILNAKIINKSNGISIEVNRVSEVFWL